MLDWPVAAAGSDFSLSRVAVFNVSAVKPHFRWDGVDVRYVLEEGCLTDP